ncbi:MAG: hypothetical protein ACD_54C00771G0003 [uncultured bacterium]|nr:MAG: hypothetical protein ACD_54C00771G0003 [uncultured bacterium]
MAKLAVFVLPVRVYHGKSGGQGFTAQVVIQHHNITFCRRNRVVAERAAIDTQDQIMRGAQLGHRRNIRAVAFVNAVGDIERRLRPHRSQPDDQKRCR